MLTCYFDEAGGSEHGFTVVAGYVASVQQWDQFEVDWKLFLISYKVPYFHMAQLSQSKEPYKKWKNSPNFRARFLHDASQIIQCRVRRAFACYVRHEDFTKADEEYKLKEIFGSPYALAARLCVANSIFWRWKTKEQSDLEYVFEDGGPDKGGLMRCMDIPPRLPAPVFRPSRDIFDRKVGLRRGIVQLQAADYLAYEIRKYVQDHPKYKTLERKPRGSLAALTGVEMDTYFLGYERLARVCQELRVARR